MLQPPVRPNLVAQTVRILTEEIASGRFHTSLPGEFPLCESLQISRTTLRAALQILERQGYLRARQGRSRVILKPKRTGRAQPEKRSIGLLAAEPLTLQNRHTSEVITQVMLSLERLGFDCKYHSDPKFSAGSPDAALRRLCAETPGRIWILVSCSAATQAWFYGRGLATFVLGHLHPGIRLPAFDLDSRSVGQHAAAQLLSRGHRRMGIILPDPFSAGDLSAETGFVETALMAGILRGELILLKLKWHRNEIEKLVAGLLRRRERPTALFILHEETALCLYSCLVQNGLRVPEDISIIIGDGGRLLERFFPDFAHYRTDLAVEVKRTCNLVRTFASQGALHATSHLLMPEFHRGETIASPPAM